MKVLVEKIVNDPGLVTPTAAFFMQRVINVKVEELKREPQVTRENPSHTVSHQPPLAPRRSKNPEPDTFVISVLIVKIKNSEIARKTRVKSTDYPADHDHYPMQAVV